MKYFIEGFKKAFDFKGRSTRTQYWMFCLFYSIIALLLNLPAAFAGEKPGIVVVIIGFVYIIYWLLTIIPCTSIAVRRMHDVNKSGWWILINLIPLIGFIWFLILAVLPTVEEGNRWPKA
ncbi:MAG: DUF805 domain-containing protein [Elusimicrobiota bacterium]|jgi:uncharacterized membrane protein YhaH (DUF805 family)|nr:DUF805 domain-containing protein [Elusimicrobiota bacterium]